jgi:hypothetical protein
MADVDVGAERAHGARARRLRAILIGAGVVAALWSLGFVLFLSATSVVTIELPVLAPHPAEEHDVAAARFGPTVRVSSYLADVYNQHHPAFLVDERASPTRVEKWASDENDPHPWVEIRWRGLHDITRVVIEHAGSVEDPGLTNHTYSLTCLEAGGRGRTLAVTGNTDPVTTHALACPSAIGLRADFTPDGPDGIVRVFEIAAWGR